MKQRWRILRRRWLAARQAWRGEALPYLVEEGAMWSSDLRFQQNQSVLRIIVFINNELLRDADDHAASNMIVNTVTDLAREAVRDRKAALVHPQA